MKKLRQWALGYLAAAWIVVQIIDVLSDSWGIEPGVERWVHIALGAGFLVVLGYFAIKNRTITHTPVLGPNELRRFIPLGGWVLAALLVASLGYTAWSSNRTTWARTEILPEAQRLADLGQYADALFLADQAGRFLSGDPTLERVLESSSIVATVTTTPPGAEVFMKEYAEPDDSWRNVGQSPVEDLRIPRGYKQWRIEKPGYEPVLWAPYLQGSFEVNLHEEGTWPDQSVHVPADWYSGWTFETGPNLNVRLPDFYYDQFEVTNQQFSNFVEAGGYENAALWQELSDLGGLPGALKHFVDSTERLGPADWELGAPQVGRKDLPVSWISWYEALAYCRSQGKTLPTLYHWSGSSGVVLMASDVAAMSNFSSDGPELGSKSRSVGHYGTYDLAGNMREWIWNQAGDGRLILGGAWNDPEYFINHAQTFDPMDRSEGNGFRCVLETDETEDRSLALAPVELNSRDYYNEIPVPDAIFEVYRQQFTYDVTPLEAKVEESGQTPDGFEYEVVSLNPAYQGSRLRVLVMLPDDVSTPRQAVVIFPGSTALIQPDVGAWTEPWELSPEYLLRSGRAVIVPVLKGTYSRQDGLRSTWPSQTKNYSDYAVRWAQDVSRTLDYLATRRDIDSESMAFWGFSWGGRMGPIILALEDRFKVGILVSGGLASGKSLPEVDQINYVTRVTMPILMLNGLRDSVEPYATAQKPLFDLIGTHANDKRHVTFEGVGHLIPRTPAVRETINWLDRYLGPPESD